MKQFFVVILLEFGARQLVIKLIACWRL